MTLSSTVPILLWLLIIAVTVSLFIVLFLRARKTARGGGRDSSGPRGVSVDGVGHVRGQGGKRE